MRNAILGAILLVFAFLHVYRMGELSFTWDEAGDLAIVQCLQRTGNPFACLDDVSQTRLPFYIHALLGHHHWVSFAFSLVTLLAVYAHARREHGPGTANVFAALYATSPALLASGRMVLTHSSIVFTCFTTLSLLVLMPRGAGSGAPLEGMKAVDRLKPVLHSALFTGLAAASHVLAAFNALFLAPLYAMQRKKSWRDLWLIPLALATFFASTIIYLSPPVFASLVDALRAGGGKYPFWNYLGLGTERAPWFFPFLLLAIKAGPWIAFAFHRQARWFLIALGVNLLLKGVVFGYETPHHQVQFYPLLYLFIAVGIVSSWRRAVRGWRVALGCVLVVLSGVQLFDVYRFFPNYLFYGAQYGERFIGEFYGPAVLHAQGRSEVLQVIESIRSREPEAKFLVADNNMFDVSGDAFVPFTKRDPNVRYEYALVDRLYATHFRFPERDAYNALLAEHYAPLHTTEFPTGKWVYRVMAAKGFPAATPTQPQR